NVQDIYPLAPLQEGMLFHHLVDPAHDAYVEAGLIACDSRERLDLFLGAMQQVINRHDILRTSIAWQGLVQPQQVVHRQATLPITQLHFDAADGDVSEQLAARIDPQHYRLDISRAPLMHAYVTQDQPNGRWVLRLLTHHLAIDHPTLELMIDEALTFERGQGAGLPTSVPFRNFIAQICLGETSAEHEPFFRDMLQTVEEPTAPFDILDVQGDGRGVREARRHLDPALAQQLRERARRNGMTAASLIHLAWAMVLARLTGRQDVVFGTVFFGRMQGGSESDRSLGMFMNTLPIRIQIDQQPLLGGLKQTHKLLAELLRHEHAPLALAQRCSGVPAKSPLFTTILNYRHSPESLAGAAGIFDAALPGLALLGSQERTNMPICVDVDDLGDDFALTAQVVEGISPSRICDFLEHAIEALVAALADTPAVPLQQLDVLPAAEREQVVVGWNQTYQDLPLSSCVQELFEARVAAAPDAIALVQPDLTLSYGEL
ncbi:Condensation domain-containing protein, partial [Andreprevotia lacus DSM 23236]